MQHCAFWRYTVLSGDFCQLPPVPDRDEHGASIPATFAFEAESWKSCMQKLVILRHVFRQSDQKFIDMLNSVRFGRVTPQITADFMKLSRRVIYSDGIEPTDLCPTRQEADSINIARLNRLNGPQFNYPAADQEGVDEKYKPYPPYRVNAALGRLVAPKDITLKASVVVFD
ncbi:hypothetical protein FOMPIDRAFT_1157614 [Fomitopsis schrenkii]|uniref:ATP-dependent DNA helicase n=1 Tax=Fomitopsis schrenkii TaxID=2126942 RepID=S8EJK4_FOMSC|nr:hypothetical protein FOMPIDRAFT_1157614 [Fomitopsis schrenkii]